MVNRVGGKRKFSSYFRFPTSHTTCGSTYSGSLFYVQSNIVVHKTGIACSSELFIGRCVMHYALRICPVTLAAIPIDACPIWFDTAFNEIATRVLRYFQLFHMHIRIRQRSHLSITINDDFAFANLK